MKWPGVCVWVMSVAAWGGGGGEADLARQRELENEQKDRAALEEKQRAIQEQEVRAAAQREERKRRAIEALLPAEMTSEEGKRAIAAETMQESVSKVAGATSRPANVRAGSEVSGIEVACADLRVRKLIREGLASEKARQETVAAIQGVIQAYVLHHKAGEVLGDKSFEQGWRTGYDELLIVLAGLGDGSSLSLVVRAYECHQEEIDNKVDMARPAEEWKPVDYGHGPAFLLYFDQGMRNRLADRTRALPKEAQDIVEQYIARQKDDQKTKYQAEGREIVVAYPWGAGQTLKTVQAFYRVMQAQILN